MKNIKFNQLQTRRNYLVSQASLRSGTSIFKLSRGTRRAKSNAKCYSSGLLIFFKSKVLKFGWRAPTASPALFSNSASL